MAVNSSSPTGGRSKAATVATRPRKSRSCALKYPRRLAGPCSTSIQMPAGRSDAARLVRSGSSLARTLLPKAPLRPVPHQLLIHGMEHCFPRVAVGQVADPAFPGFVDPSSGGSHAFIGAALEEQVHLGPIRDWSGVLVRDLVVAHTLRHWMA